MYDYNINIRKTQKGRWIDELTQKPMDKSYYACKVYIPSSDSEYKRQHLQMQSVEPE